MCLIFLFFCFSINFQFVYTVPFIFVTLFVFVTSSYICMWKKIQELNHEVPEMYLKIVNAWYFLTLFTSPNHLKAGKCCFQESVIKTVSDDVTSSSETLEPENTFEGVLTSDVSTQTMHCVSSDKACQASTKSSKSVGSLRPYSSYNNRRQSDL